MWTCQQFCKLSWLFTSITAIMFVPVMAVYMHQARYAPHAILWFVAGVFVLLAIPISIFEVSQHLENYSRPLQQKKIIRILFMVPIYAIDSWLALRFNNLAIYIDTVRECYEAYVIYSFFEFLVAFIGDENILICILSEKSQVNHIWPFTFLKPWAMGEPFLQNCKAGVHNYVFLRPLTTILALFCEWGGEYSQGQLVFDKAYLYLTLINNASQIWAIYCLVLFYKATHEELKPMKPFSKFLCVKAVVFFSWWQSVGIDLLTKFGIITAVAFDSTNYSKDNVSTSIQDFLICIEMFFAAIAHAYAFAPEEYMDSPQLKRTFWQGITDMLDITDITSDMYGQAKHTTKTLQGGVSQLASSINIIPVAQSQPHVQLPATDYKDNRSGAIKIEMSAQSLLQNSRDDS